MLFYTETENNQIKFLVSALHFLIFLLLLSMLLSFILLSTIFLFFYIYCTIFHHTKVTYISIQYYRTFNSYHFKFYNIVCWFASIYIIQMCMNMCCVYNILYVQEYIFLKNIHICGYVHIVQIFANFAMYIIRATYAAV